MFDKCETFKIKSGNMRPVPQRGGRPRPGLLELSSLDRWELIWIFWAPGQRWWSGLGEDGVPGAEAQPSWEARRWKDLSCLTSKTSVTAVSQRLELECEVFFVPFQANPSRIPAHFPTTFNFSSVLVKCEVTELWLWSWFSSRSWCGAGFLSAIKTNNQWEQ